MKVKELIKLLQKVENQEREVIMSKDGEGNNFSPLSDISCHSYEAETTWYGEIGLETLTDELRTQGFTEEDMRPNGTKALVLWPVN